MTKKDKWIVRSSLAIIAASILYVASTWTASWEAQKRHDQAIRHQQDVHNELVFRCRAQYPAEVCGKTWGLGRVD